MLRITTEKKRCKVILTVEGRLAGPWVAALEQCWREMRANSPNEKFRIDLCGVSFIDPAGKTLLKEIHSQGGRLIAEGCLNQAIVREISAPPDSDKGKGEGSKGSHIVFYVALFSLLVTPALTPAQSTGQRSPLPANPPTEVLRLTLDQAVGLAVKQNTTAQIAILTAAQGVQDKNTARAELLPHADLNVNDSVQRINLQAFLGKKIPGFPEHGGPFQVFQAGPSFGMPIFDLTLFRRYQAAGYLANASRADSATTATTAASSSRPGPSASSSRRKRRSRSATPRSCRSSLDRKAREQWPFVELPYRSKSGVMSVRFAPGASLSPGEPVTLFDDKKEWDDYDVAADRRMVVPRARK